MRKHIMGEHNVYNPYRPDSVFRWKGSVIPHVITHTMTVTIVTVIVTILYELTNIKLSVTKGPGANIFSQIIGIVVGLLLTYRTNTAYDRYWEGRKLWSTMVVQIRNLTRYIWIGVREDVENDKKHKSEIVIEKRTALNLLLGFAVAVKHYLREEPGYEYDDLKHLVSNIQSTLPAFNPPSAENSNIKGARKVGWYTQFIHRKIKKDHIKNIKKNKFSPEDHNIPLDISLFLSSYCGIQFGEDRADVTIANQLHPSLNSLCDCLSQFERILRSPIPLAYAIHLSQTVWIYCLSLPFFLVSSSNWATIIIVFFVSLILFGLEHIGTEIENPFGYDRNDLQLDHFCDLIRRELDAIASRPPPTTRDWIYVPENFPFENKEVNALDAVNLNLDEVRSLLSVKSNPHEEEDDDEKDEKNREVPKGEEEVEINPEDEEVLREEEEGETSGKKKEKEKENEIVAIDVDGDGK